MKIVHASDNHGRTKPRLPPADVYVFSGDCLPDFPLRSDPPFLIYDKGYSISQQEHWVDRWAGRFRDKMFHESTRDAPVVCVRGNHDFVDIARMFKGEVYEVKDPNETFEVKGLKFGGFRGVRQINGQYSDELSDSELYDAAAALPKDLDVLVTHTPPLGILDKFFAEYLGSSAINRYLNSRLYEDGLSPLKLHCFGHVHGQHGMTEREGMVFSNAATTFNVIELT